MLTKHSVLMSIDGDVGTDDPVLIFAVQVEDPADYGHVIYLDRRAWTEMGEPETFTVTIEPGDHLND